jgi:signal transduction histidine kinase
MRTDGSAPPASGQAGRPEGRVSVSRSGPAHPTGVPLQTVSFIAAVVLVALAGLVAGLAVRGVPPEATWPTLTFFALLTVLAEHFAPQIDSRTKTSVSVVTILGATLYAGVLGSLAAVLAYAVYVKVRAGSPTHRMLFNFGMALLAAQASGWAFALLVPDGPARGPFELMLLPAALAGLVYYAVNHLLLSGVRGAAEGRAFWRIWAADYAWLWPHYPVLGVLGLLVALTYDAFGWSAVVALAAPVGMMQVAIRQYVARTTASIRELEALNGELQREIAQRRAAEEENARLVRQAARVAALEELSRLKSEFISIASHELRTPLTGILGFSELLSTGAITEDDQRQRYQRMVYEQAEQLAALVDNLLDVSRIEAGRVQLHSTAIDLEEVVRSVLEPIRAAAPLHALSAEIEPPARRLHADAGKVRQVLVNLVGNAVKYSPAGGAVTVVARSESATGLVRISVADQGLGIPPELRDRVFDRFQRVDTADTRGIRGTGLGLYIVKELVELHGGRVELESEVGRGSTFHVTLPASPQPDATGTQERRERVHA